VSCHHHHCHPHPPSGALGAAWFVIIAFGTLVFLAAVAGVATILAAGVILWGVIVLARAGWRRWR